MGWLVLGLRPAVENGVRSDSKEVCARHEVGMSFARADGRGAHEGAFSQNRVGLRSFEDAGLGGSPSAALSGGNASGLGRHLAVRLAAAGECVVVVPPKLSARVRVLSSFAGNARKNDGLDALATAFCTPHARSG